MTKVNIYFKNRDYIEKECRDILLDHGMMLIFNKEFSEDLEDVATEAINLDTIESFEVIRIKDEEGEEE